MIFILWATGVEPTGTLYGLPFVKTLNETNHLSIEERGYKEANIRDIPDALIARSSCSGSGTVVTGDFGRALEGEQATAEQLLVGWC
jgi:hypothetical protein